MLGDDFPEVLSAARDGSMGAIERLYRDLVAVVTGYARAHGAAEPDDLASEVFVAMIRGLESFAGDERHFRSWILTITHRRVVDEFRRRGRDQADLTPDAQLESSADVLVDGEADALARLAARGVLDAIDRLSEDQRTVLLLRVLADLPVREVADILGKSEGAVKALQHRALQVLQRAIEAEDEGWN